jgi:hypothetical protein
VTLVTPAKAGAYTQKSLKVAHTASHFLPPLKRIGPGLRRGDGRECADLGLVLRPLGESGGKPGAGAMLAFAQHRAAIVRLAGLIGHQRHIGVGILRIVMRDHLFGGGEVVRHKSSRSHAKVK